MKRMYSLLAPKSFHIMLVVDSISGPMVNSSVGDRVPTVELEGLKVLKVMVHIMRDQEVHVSRSSKAIILADEPFS